MQLLNKFAIFQIFLIFFCSTLSDSEAISAKSISKRLDKLLHTENLFSGLGFSTRRGKAVGFNLTRRNNATLLQVLQDQLDDSATLGLVYKQYLKQYEGAEDHPKPEGNLDIFKERLLDIACHNLGQQSYEKGVNQFTDTDYAPEKLTPIDPTRESTPTTTISGRSRRKYYRKNKSLFHPHPPLQLQPAPWFPKLFGRRSSEETSLDWRNYGAVSYPKNQGRCGSCSFFATVAAFESHNYLVQLGSSSAPIWGSPPDLSEQELLDCARNFTGYRGCNDNLPTTALDYMRHHGLSFELDYPYQDRVGRVCYAYSAWNRKKLKLGGYFPVLPSHDEERLKEVVRDFGPVIASMYMSLDLKMYRKGIYDQECRDKDGISHNIFRNHMVLLVGYGREWVDENKGWVDFWVVKNSYGPFWGDGGYFRIVRNKRLCLLGEEAYYLHTGAPLGAGLELDENKFK